MNFILIICGNFILELIFCAVIMAMGVTKSCAACTQFDGPALKAVSNGANQFSTSFYKVRIVIIVLLIEGI